MVLDHFFPQEHGATASLVEVAVHGPVQSGAPLVIKPVLRAVGREHGMFHGKNKGSSRPQGARRLAGQVSEIFHIVEGQGTQDHVKDLGRVFVILQGDVPVLDGPSGRMRPRPLQHSGGNIEPQHGGRAPLGGIDAVPTEAAAQVQHPQSREIGSSFFNSCHSPAARRPSTERGIRLYTAKKRSSSYLFSFMDFLKLR